MLLDLRKIGTPLERYEKVYAPEAFGSGPADAGNDVDFRVAAPVTLAFDIVKDKETFRLAGSVRTTLGLTCSRCLEPFTLPVDASFDLMYQPHAENKGEGELEIEEDDLTTAFYEHDEIDLGQLMREQFYLSLPMKPLCRADCKGLCPSCGTNWNSATCECRREWEDPRFKALKELRIKNSELRIKN
ncbi:MAG: DUF177 domain-containing protein [Acidobacteria bacterium]|nr:DUF177 domain-containing protein [Acidobacteriota bacterium]